MSLPKKMYKFGHEGRAALLEGMSLVNKIVSRTMGGQGRLTLLQYGPRNSIVSKDGMMSARQVYHEDPFCDKGTAHILSAMFKTTKTSGDGTSLTCLLTYEIFKNAVKYIVSGANPVKIKQGIDLAVQDIIAQIKAMATPIKDSNDLFNIARIAINNDIDIAKLIQQAIDEVGKDGTITCRESREKHNEIEFIKGMTYSEGFESPEFINDFGNYSWTAENPYVLCFKGEIHTHFELAEIGSKVLSENRPLLIICHEMEVQPLISLLTTKVKFQFNVCVITTPGQNIGRNRDEILQDIAIYTKSDTFSEFGSKVENATLENLGSAKRIIVKENETVIIDGAGEKKNVEARISALDKQIAESDNDTETERLRIRKARLSSGVAIIHIGATTGVEMSEKKDRVEDALQAVHAAQQEGIVAGGGIALLNCKPEYIRGHDTDDKQAGYDLVFKTKKAPIKQILENAGIEDTESIITKCLEWKGHGYDVEGMELKENMKDSGIVDPALVITTAISNAGSVAGTLLLTESLIVNKDVKE